MIKTYLKSYGYLLGIIIILTTILSLLNYFIPFKAETIKIIIPILAMLVAGIILGKNVREKAYLEGIKFSSIYIILVTIIKLLIKSSFNYKVIIMYVTLLITSIIGSMLGINLKKE